MFKFKMNNQDWKIIEDSQENIQRMLASRGTVIEAGNKWYGLTMADSNLIILDKDLVADRKRLTLIHELTHCYIISYIAHIDKPYCEEEVCDIVSNSLDIIFAIVTKYFKKGGDNKKKR